MPPSKIDRTKVFISYAREDEKWLEELRVFLKRLEREKLVDSPREVQFSDETRFWDDSRITPGQKWGDEIKKALGDAKVAVLLVSQNFLASSYVLQVELPLMLEAARNGDLTILPVLTSPSSFEDFPPLSGIQAVNGTKILEECRPAQRKRVWIKLVKEIRDILLQNEQR